MEKICPILSLRHDATEAKCLREECAWWHDDDICAVSLIALAVDTIVASQ